MEEESNSINQVSVENENKTLSNILQTEMINFTVSQKKNEIEYDLRITNQTNSWEIKRKLSEIISLIKCLQGQKYVFINCAALENFNQYNIKETNESVIDILRYINYRHDLLSNQNTHQFFSFESNDSLKKQIQSASITPLYFLTLDNVDMSLSDFNYDSETGIFISALEDVSFFSRIGRFWSLIDYEILGTLFVFQRVYDKNRNPYFKKLVVKNFDARVSKLQLVTKFNKIIVGLDNGTIMIFNINVFPSLRNDSSSNEDLNITISEGVHFRHFSERITGLAALSDTFVAVSKDNKIMIIDFNNRNEVFYSASINKRIEGKGYINCVVYEESQKRLYITTITDLLLIYEVKQSPKFNNNDLKPEYRLEFIMEIKCEKYIKSLFAKNNSVFVGLENKINFFYYNSKLNKYNSDEIHLDGSLDKNISLSSRFYKLGYNNHITAICFFNHLKLIVLGLSTGIVMAMDSKTLEVVFAKKTSEYKIVKIVLLEENYIFVVGDINANIHFFRFGL